jgi:hypothetical protein
VEGKRRVVEADLGPVRYLATLIGADTRRSFDGSFSWLRLLDPAAVLLG